MVRSVIFNIVFYFSIPVFGIFFLPFLTSRRLTRLVVKMWANFIILSLRFIIGIKINFTNDYIKRKKGYLIAANHQSVFDTIFFLTTFDKVIYIIKKELKGIPIYGWYAARLGHIFLDRNQKVKSMKIVTKNIKNLIKQGYKIIIFPEGTRQLPNTIGNMKPGIFAMQALIKSKVYPIYINSGNSWPKKSFKKNKVDIFVKALTPVEKSENKKVFLNKLKDIFLEAKKNISS